jgi:hypothetical protein
MHTRQVEIITNTLIRRLIRPWVPTLRRMVGATYLSYAYGDRSGIGDHLMLSTIARELKRRGQRRVFIATIYPELFHRNPDVDGVAIPGSRMDRLFIRLAGDRIVTPTYVINMNPVTEERDQPPDPILAYLCRLAGITGRVEIRPYITLSGSERDCGAPYRGCIAVQSTGLGGRVPLPNKEWFPERFAEVAAHLIKTRPVVQIGSPGDPPVPCTHDLRGRTSLRQLAGLLSQCRLLVAPVGMPMHMARAVDCPSVIVYGGRERPDQTGYICNANIYNGVACAPCWLDSRCEFGRVCMEQIWAATVIEAAERMLARPRRGLAVESYAVDQATWARSLDPLGGQLS